MLRATRLVTASKRGFATVVDAAPGFKVAAVDNGQPTSSVTVLLKAGSRYESKPGVAHTLSNFAFKVRLHVQLSVGCPFGGPWGGGAIDLNKCDDVHSRLCAWVKSAVALVRWMYAMPCSWRIVRGAFQCLLSSGFSDAAGDSSSLPSVMVIDFRTHLYSAEHWEEVGPWHCPRS